MARTPGPRGGTDVAESTSPVATPATPDETASSAPVAPQTGDQPTTNESGAQDSATPTSTEASAPAKAEKSDDLTAFKAAVAEAYGQADETTGTVPEAVMARVVSEYRSLGTKGRAEARKSLNEDMRTYLQNREVPKAQAAVKMSDAVQQGGTTPKAAKAPAEPVDPTEAFVARAVTYDLAKRLAIQTVPEGVKDDWAAQAAKMRDELQPQIERYQEWLTARGNVAEGEEPPAKPEGISAVVEAAFKLAQGRAAGASKKTSSTAKSSFDGPRRSVKTHILQAFENEPVGAFLKVSDIQKFQSREYGTDRPSSGAISSALESKNLPDSLESGMKDGHKGAYKRA